MGSSRTEQRPLTLADHLQELRTRLMFVVLWVGVGSAIAYYFRDEVQQLVLRPLSQELYYTSPIGGFDFVFKLCLLVGLIVAVPAACFHTLKFLRPILKGGTQFYIAKRLAASCLLFVLGATFAYIVALPMTLHFLNNFTAEGIAPLITTTEYLSFVMTYILVFGLIFQTPLIISITNDITPLSPQALASKRRYVIAGSFIVAAIVSPTPDPVNQTIMALPIIALLELSVLVLRLNRRGKPAPTVVQPVSGPTSRPAPTQPRTAPLAPRVRQSRPAVQQRSQVSGAAHSRQASAPRSGLITDVLRPPIQLG